MRTNVLGPHRNAHSPGALSAAARAYRSAQSSEGRLLKLAGKVALINARDMDMALAVAVSFSQEGARLALCNVADVAAARALRSRLNASGHVCLIASETCDGRDSCRRMVEGVVAQLGALDIVVNCGSADRHPEVDQITCVESTFRSSAFDYLYLMAAALPYLPEGGSIINSSSLDADDRNGGPARAAAESAIAALTRSFADAAANRGVRVNAVARAPALRSHALQHGAGARAGGGVADSRDDPASGVAATCVFLASADSSRITGQIFHINLGGIFDGQT